MRLSLAHFFITADFIEEFPCLLSAMSIMSDAPTLPNGGKWELTYWK